jgi:hypothetical protein
LNHVQGPIHLLFPSVCFTQEGKMCQFIWPTIPKVMTCVKVSSVLCSTSDKKNTSW